MGDAEGHEADALAVARDERHADADLILERREWDLAFVDG
jgi:hypothetical protein